MTVVFGPMIRVGDYIYWLRIVTAGGVIPTQRGEIIGIFHQYASVPQG